MTTREEQIRKTVALESFETEANLIAEARLNLHTNSNTLGGAVSGVNEKQIWCRESGMHDTATS